MTNVIEIRSHANESESRTSLDALCLEGARTMLHQALEVEVEAYLGRHQGARDENGRALVTRHGKARARQVTIGAGTMTVEAPRVRDRRVDESGGTGNVSRAAFCRPTCAAPRRSQRCFRCCICADCRPGTFSRR